MSVAMPCSLGPAPAGWSRHLALRHPRCRAHGLAVQRAGRRASHRQSRAARSSPSAIDSALRSIDGEIAAAARDSQSRGGPPRPTQLLFYYSGHSDEAGLLLGDQRLSYSHLRSLLQGVHADVKIAILDSCASGAFALRKGGRSEAAFLTADPRPYPAMPF